MKSFPRTLRRRLPGLLRLALRPLRFELAARDCVPRQHRAVQAAASPWSGMWRYRSVLPSSRTGDIGRRLDADAVQPALSKCVSEGRRCQPDLHVQGARTRARRDHGAALRPEKTGRAFGRKCRGSSRGVRSRGGHRSAHLHAERCAVRQLSSRPSVYGANVNLVDGLISDCGRIVAERKEKEGWFDVSTLKEPFRVEGKKTMGYELVEQLGWEYPDAVFYPTGGGVGLIGMWKAFSELEELGWVRPRQTSPHDRRAVLRMRARGPRVRTRG